MRISEFFRRRGFLVVYILIVGIISLFGFANEVNASFWVETDSFASFRDKPYSSDGKCENNKDCWTTGLTTSGYAGNDDSSSLNKNCEVDYYLTFTHNFYGVRESGSDKQIESGYKFNAQVTTDFTIKPENAGSSSQSNGGAHSYNSGFFNFDNIASTCSSLSSAEDYSCYDVNHSRTGGPYRYVMGPRKFTDSKYSYIHRDYFKVNFSAEGDYHFCETITGKANGKSASSTACAYVTVTGSKCGSSGGGTTTKHTMRVIARDVDGNKLNKSNSKESSDELCAKDIGKWSITGYKLKGYTTDSSGSTGLEDSFCRSMTEDYTVYAVYENELSFIGKSDVNSLSTGFIKEDSNKLLELKNCSFTEGCIVTFKHYLKKDKGEEGTTSYEIKQDSSYDSKIKTITTSGSMSNPSSGGNGDSPIYTSKIKIYPGMIVCQRLTFNSDGASNSVILQVCAFATGTTNSSLDMVVKNKTLGTEYGKEVYAKPGDEIIYKTTYNPTAQYAYFVPMNIINVNGTKKYDGGETLASVSNLRSSSSAVGIGDWNNAFSVTRKNFTAEFGRDYKYDNGDTIEKTEENRYTIDDSDVGDLEGIAVTNQNKNTKTVPKQVKFTVDEKNGRLILDIDTSPIKDSAHVYVPYNFVNTAKITEENEIAYAGETKSVQFKVETKGKKNSKTSPNEAYMTKVPNKKVKIETCVDENCSENEINGNIEQYSINVPDITAGKKICVRVGVYPSSSGADDNWNNPEGSGKWTYSETKCFDVAKKPSIQIWGGNVFSNENISVPISNKTKLAGYPDGNYAFGSWVELGLIANGTVTGLASGAGMGYKLNDDGNLWPKYDFGNVKKDSGNNVGDYNTNIGKNPPGGGTSQSFCDMSTLSFANNGCNNSVGNLGDENSVEVDKSTLISKLKPESGEKYFVGAEVNLNDESKKVDGTNRFYYYSENDLTLNGGEVSEETTQLVESRGNVTVNGNIIYQNQDGYASLNEIPKLFIYAKNININCHVIQIDAVLIAEEMIITCNNLGEKIIVPEEGVERTRLLDEMVKDKINERVNSNQLFINGTIIADKLIANRTYGAATGANSIIPAEIINYDSTLYLWGQNNAESLNVGKLETVYQHELAPRY